MIVIIIIKARCNHGGLRAGPGLKAIFPSSFSKGITKEGRRGREARCMWRRGRNKLLSRLIIIYTAVGRRGGRRRRRGGSHGKLEKARENFNCRDPFHRRRCRYWRATLIKRGDPGQPAGLILKRRCSKGPRPPRVR